MNPPHLYLGREAHDTLVVHPYASPIIADLSSLPPLLFQAGGGEVLRDEIVLTAQRAASAGVQVELDVFMGTFHVFQGRRALLLRIDTKLIAVTFTDSIYQNRSISSRPPLNQSMDRTTTSTDSSRFQQDR